MLSSLLVAEHLFNLRGIQGCSFTSVRICSDLEALSCSQRHNEFGLLSVLVYFEQFQCPVDGPVSLAMFETPTPSLIEITEIFTKIVIPSGLLSPDCEAAVNMLMTFPILRSATIKHMSPERAGQYYGLEILTWPCDAAVNPIGDLSDPGRDRAAISSFLNRNEPSPR